MDEESTPGEREIIERYLQRKQSGILEPGVPAEKIRVFLARVGEAIERDGRISKTNTDELLRKLRAGELTVESIG